MPHQALKSNVNNILINEQCQQIMQKLLHIIAGYWINEHRVSLFRANIWLAYIYQFFRQRKKRKTKENCSFCRHCLHNRLNSQAKY